MDEETAYEFGLAIVIIFAIFNYLYAGATFLATLIAIVAIVAVILLLKGLVQYLVGKNKENIWAGTIFIMILVIMFGALPTVLKALGFILALAVGLVKGGLAYLASLV